MTPVGDLGPICPCGKPLTPADRGYCARCVLAARTFGQVLPPTEDWDQFKAWVATMDKP